MASSGAVIGHIQARKRSGIRWRKLVNYWNVQEYSNEHHDLQGLYRAGRVRRA